MRLKLISLALWAAKCQSPVANSTSLIHNQTQPASLAHSSDNDANALKLAMSEVDNEIDAITQIMEKTEKAASLIKGHKGMKQETAAGKNSDQAAEALK